MTLLSAIIGSSGTGIPAEDWKFLGADSTLEGVDYDLSVFFRSDDLMSFNFIADFDIGPDSAIKIKLGGNSAIGSYRTHVVSSTPVATSYVTATEIDVPILGDSRATLTGTFYMNNLQPYSPFVVNCQELRDASTWRMVTLSGVVDAGIETFFTTFGVTTLHNAGSRLAVWGSPNAVDAP